MIKTLRLTLLVLFAGTLSTSCGTTPLRQSTAFTIALKGYSYYAKQGIITNDTIIIVDYDLPSTAERMFVYDIGNDTILHSSLIAHGKNTGQNRALSFSNEPGSKKSSVGFFKTAEQYSGKHGLSLRLDGLEQGVNSHARSRAIVIHSAAYVSEDFIRTNKRLGRSYGCPALPFENYEEVFDLISNRQLLFIYSSQTNYQPPYQAK